MAAKRHPRHVLQTAGFILVTELSSAATAANHHTPPLAAPLRVPLITTPLKRATQEYCGGGKQGDVSRTLGRGMS